MARRCRPPRLLAGALAAALIAAVGGVARSQDQPGPPATRDFALEVGGQVAYVSAPIRGGTNPFGAGFGARLGIVVAGGLYLGARVTDFLGGSDVDVSYRALLYGVEGGYGVRVPVLGSGVFTLRPQVGIGNAAIYYTDPSLRADVVTSASGSAASESDTLTVNALYVEPALAAMLASDSHFALVKSSALVVPSIAYGGADATTWITYGVEGQVGFLF
jgi:hypothetical protein